MRPNCECCDRDLAASAAGAMICSFECTFCTDCAADRFGGRCPNCAGELVSRPSRAADRLARFPEARDRTVRPHAECAGAG